MHSLQKFPDLVNLAVIVGATLQLAKAQNIQFIGVPETIREDSDGSEDLLISWSGGTPGLPWTVQLVQDDRVIDDVDESSDDDDGVVDQTFEWDVELDSNPGGYYSLRLVQGTQTADSNPINIIDENGQGATGSSPTNVPSTPSSNPASTSAASATSTDGSASLSQASASIAATAATLVTTVISGTTITAAPSGSATDGRTSDPADGGTGSDGLPGGAVAGIVIGAIGLVTLIVLLVWFVRRRARNSRRSHGVPSTVEPEKREPDFATPALFAGIPRSGATLSDKGGNGKFELQSDAKALRTTPGVHEMHSPDETTNASSDLYELPSPDASQTAASIRQAHTTSNASGTDRSDGKNPDSHEIARSADSHNHQSVSPSQRHAIPRKTVPGTGVNGKGSGRGQPPAVHELG
ncbi:uncharacterized protein HMPREF1541_07013 [Cyphellophora europaea CBS 101466]|uniref:Mid2 domain-containing protein n=1 Tax=Cyphellophora europaea (strain CBS 101466) TaxID=1220924 RepID=W2RR37_CYPE1|nr:uncharacterized protein HMPREF1541_07013 [Cyphellophora europaea CBS 101466]ETN38971.1 hypothetical protein HMPREF1541_07013 [Cyphellophora europaea CBS 101466]